MSSVLFFLDLRLIEQNNNFNKNEDIEKKAKIILDVTREIV